MSALLTSIAFALPAVRGGTRDARDAHVWIEEQPRGPGITAAGIRLQPTLPVGVRFDDDVFASDAREDGDVVFSLTPSIVGERALGPHMLRARAYTRSDFYLDRTRLDNTEVGVGIAARFHAYDWLSFTLHGDYDDLHEDFDSPDSPINAAEQVELDQLSGGFGAHFRFGRLSTDADFTYLEVNVDDVAAIGGGSIDLVGRNRDTVDVTIELGWQLNARLRPFARYRWNDHGYDQAPPRVLADRDGSGKAIVGGFDFTVPEQVSLKVYAGYVSQDFKDDDFNLEEADGLGYGMEMNWQLSPGTRVKVGGLREIEEASFGLESGRFATTWRAQASHRLSDRLEIDAELGYVERDYVTSPRQAETWSGGLGATWQLPFDLYTRLAWRYAERDSNAFARSYSRNQTWLWLGWRR
jgi:hypothetical protein